MIQSSLRVWVCITGLLIIIPSVHAQISITEVMYDPPSKRDAGYEWLEIVNDSAEKISVTKLRLAEGNTNHFIKAGSGAVTDLSPGEVGVIVQDEDIFRSEYPQYSEAVFVSKFSLRQSGGVGESLGIYDPKTKEVLFSVTYKPNEQANATGATIHITGDSQVASPATPGTIAINPITPEKKEEKVTAEEKQLVAQVQELVAPRPTSEPLNTVLITQPQPVSASPSTAPVIVTVPGNNTPVLIWIAIMLTSIALELLFLIRSQRQSKIARDMV